MKRIVVLFFALIIVLFIPSQVFATDSGKNVVLQKGQTVNHDYFAAGETVTLSGIVNGDAYVAGGNVIVEGVVNGDLLAAGGTVTVRGKVAQDARVAGGQINITGEIGRNITTVGGSVDIADSAKINGSLTAGTGNINVFAPIKKGITAGAGQLTLGNSIDGDVKAGVGQLAFTPNGKVNGNVTYWSDAKAQLHSNAQVTGKITHHIPPQPTEEQKNAARKAASAFNPIFNLLSFLAALVVGLLMVKFMPVNVKQTSKIILTKPVLSLGVGLLVVVLAPIILVFLLITVIGIPLSLILLALFLILIYLAKIFVGVALGQKVLQLMNKKTALGWTLVIGLGIYYILTMVPVLGFIFWMLAGLTGLGAIFLERKNVYGSLRKKGKI